MNIRLILTFFVLASSLATAQRQQTTLTVDWDDLDAVNFRVRDETIARVVDPDGSIGEFRFDIDSTATVNSTPTGPGTISNAPGGVGRWLRQYQGAVKLSWFGSDSAGANSSTEAFEKMLGVANSDFYVPKGTYRTSSVLLPGNCNLTFEAGTTINAYSKLQLSATITTGTDRITSTAHGIPDGELVQVNATTYPTAVGGDLNGSTTYYVVNSTANDFQIARTRGGAAIDITSTGSAVNVYMGVMPTYGVIGIPDVSNITVIGNGVDITMTAGTELEFRHGMGIRAGENISISGVDVINAIGDGFAVGNGNTLFNENIRLTNCRALGCRRNGFSIGSATSVVLDQCVGNDTGKSAVGDVAPSAGLDIEPGGNGELNCVLDNCVVENCTFNNNLGRGIVVGLATSDECGVNRVSTFDNATDTWTSVGHGFVAGDRILLYNSEVVPGVPDPPLGYNVSTYYYVISAGLTSDAFRLATRDEGTVVDGTDNGTGTHTARNVLKDLNITITATNTFNNTGGGIGVGSLEGYEYVSSFANGTDTWTSNGHGFSAGDRVWLKSRGVLPTGYNSTTEYKVKSVGLTANAFQLSVDTSAGATFANGTDTWTSSGHGLVADNRVWLKSTGTLPAGYNDTTEYYVISAGLTSNAFQLSLTSEGAPVNGTDDGTGSHTFGTIEGPAVNGTTDGTGIHSAKKLDAIQGKIAIIDCIDVDSPTSGIGITEYGSGGVNLLLKDLTVIDPARGGAGGGQYRTGISIYRDTGSTEDFVQGNITVDNCKIRSVDGSMQGGVRVTDLVNGGASDYTNSAGYWDRVLIKNCEIEYAPGASRNRSSSYNLQGGVVLIDETGGGVRKSTGEIVYSIQHASEYTNAAATGAATFTYNTTFRPPIDGPRIKFTNVNGNDMTIDSWDAGHTFRWPDGSVTNEIEIDDVGQTVSLYRDSSSTWSVAATNVARKTREYGGIYLGETTGQIQTMSGAQEKVDIFALNAQSSSGVTPDATTLNEIVLVQPRTYRVTVTGTVYSDTATLAEYAVLVNDTDSQNNKWTVNFLGTGISNQIQIHHASYITTTGASDDIRLYCDPVSAGDLTYTSLYMHVESVD